RRPTTLSMFSRYTGYRACFSNETIETTSGSGMPSSTPRMCRRGTMTSRAVRSLKSRTLRIISAGPLAPRRVGARVGGVPPGPPPADGPADDRERTGEGHEQPLERAKELESEGAGSLAPPPGECSDDLGEGAVGEHGPQDADREREAIATRPARRVSEEHGRHADREYAPDEPAREHLRRVAREPAEGGACLAPIGRAV